MLVQNANNPGDMEVNTCPSLWPTRVAWARAPPTRPLGGSLKETRGVSHETELSSSSRCPASANWGESLDHPPVARYCDRCGKALLGAGGPGPPGYAIWVQRGDSHPQHWPEGPCRGDSRPGRAARLGGEGQALGRGL